MRAVATVVALAILSPHVAAADPPGPAEVAATVNGQPITVAELDAALSASLPHGTTLSTGQRRQLRGALLNDLIDDALLRQFLAKNGPKVDTAEIEAQMKLLTDRLAKENRTLAAYLKETGQTEAQLRGDWTTLIQLTGYVKREVTEAQLKAHHEANRDHFDRVEVRVSHVVLRVSPSAPAAERAAAREKLRAIRADVLAGKADFAAAARKFSQDPTAKSGGDLGFILRRGLPENEPLAKAAFALKVGAVSDVVETDYGVHILMVTDRKPGTPSVLEKCVFEVMEDYTDQYRAELTAKLRKEAQIKVTLP